MSKAAEIPKKRKGGAESTEVKKRTKVAVTEPTEPKATRSRTKAAPATEEAAPVAAIAETTSTSTKPTKAKKTAKKTKASGADDFAGFSDSDDAAEEATVAARTNALLAGFSSDEEEEDQAAAITTIPSLPDSADLQQQLTAAAADPDSVPGTIYIGRIPHGFYEPQMREYFSQFGEISRMRLSRNKKTGKPKHYGFVEFASSSVAEIVAKTMDKYLMFGHILQVRKLRTEEVHPELFKGAGRRFKAMPRNKLEGSLLNHGRGREGWEKRVKKEEKRRKVKGDELKELGYEFEMPEVKQVDSVPKRVKAAVPATEAIEATAVEEPNEIEAAKPVVETTTTVVEEENEAGTKRKKTIKEKKVTKRPRVSV